MAWYNKVGGWVVEKLNPAQAIIRREQGVNISSVAAFSYRVAFQKLEAVNRGTNLVVSACASMDYDVKNKLSADVQGGLRQKTLLNLLNYNPNPYQSVQEFRTSIFADYILDGNIFIYFDGAHLYHLPATNVQIQPDEKTFVKSYTYNNIIHFKPNEIIHIKDLNSESIYRGASRLESCSRSMQIMYKMQNFQDSFFENGAIPGIVLTSDNTLSAQAKEKTIQNWTAKYNPKNGARRPMILDSGLKPSNLLNTSFQDMDFDNSIKSHDAKILKAIGVPPILLDGGNNANISPNLRLLYLETIMPIIRRYTSALERFFGYDIEAITTSVSSLQPELKDIAAYHSTLVNAGILTPNEAREELRYDKIAGLDDIRVPANIAGSAVNPSQGGAPTKDSTGK